MRFHLITPSYNQLNYLKRCVASIRDQAIQGCELHHEVIDGASTDGTAEWLKRQGITHISESDQGMYDALNKGINRMGPNVKSQPETIFAWLNADEQYLPGTLQAVADYFATHPQADILCGDALVVDENGNLITYWKSLPLRRVYLHIGTLYNLTCAMFFRAHVFASGTRFNHRLKAVADLVLVDQLLEGGAKSVCLPRYLSTYTYATDNISNQQHAIDERLRYIRTQPAARQIFGHPLSRLCRASERFLRGARRQTFPLTYQLYTNDLDRRAAFQSGYVAGRWPARSFRKGN